MRKWIVQIYKNIKREKIYRVDWTKEPMVNRDNGHRCTRAQAHTPEAGLAG